VARLLGAAAVREGAFALAFPSFGPERRGAPLTGHTRIDGKPIIERSEVRAPDVVALLDHTLFGPAVLAGVGPSGLVLVNAPEDARLEVPTGFRVERFDASALALRILGRPIANTAVLGALVALTGYVRLESVADAVSSELKPELRASNLELLRFAYGEFGHA
jgi:pyruvate ferredoxin oxidoreductase gamma subunit